MEKICHSLQSIVSKSSETLQCLLSLSSSPEFHSNLIKESSPSSESSSFLPSDSLSFSFLKPNTRVCDAESSRLNLCIEQVISLISDLSKVSLLVNQTKVQTENRNSEAAQMMKKLKELIIKQREEITRMKENENLLINQLENNKLIQKNNENGQKDYILLQQKLEESEKQVEQLKLENKSHILELSKAKETHQQALHDVKNLRNTLKQTHLLLKTQEVMLEEYESQDQEQFLQKKISLEFKPSKPTSIGLPPKPPKTIHNFNIDEEDTRYEEEEEDLYENYSEEEENEEDDDEEDEEDEEEEEEEEEDDDEYDDDEEKDILIIDSHNNGKKSNLMDSQALRKKIESKNSTLRVDRVEKNFNFFNNELQKLASKSFSSKKEKKSNRINNNEMENNNNNINSFNKHQKEENIVNEKEDISLDSNIIESTSNKNTLTEESSLSPTSSSNLSKEESHEENIFDKNDITILSDPSTSWTTVGDVSESFVLIQKYYGRYLDKTDTRNEYEESEVIKEKESEDENFEEEIQNKEDIYEEEDSQDLLPPLSFSSFSFPSSLSPINSYERNT